MSVGGGETMIETLEYIDFDYIKNNPKSEILKAPDFADFKYAGSGSWRGDWHREQYVVWQNNASKNETRKA